MYDNNHALKLRCWPICLAVFAAESIYMDWDNLSLASLKVWLTAVLDPSRLRKKKTLLGKGISDPAATVYKTSNSLAVTGSWDELPVTSSTKHIISSCNYCAWCLHISSAVYFYRRVKSVSGTQDWWHWHFIIHFTYVNPIQLSSF